MIPVLFFIPLHPSLVATERPCPVIVIIWTISGLKKGIWQGIRMSESDNIPDKEK
jgi:hypothetical protein